MCIGLASVFSSLSSNVPVQFTQQEVILSCVWTVACCLQETKKNQTKSIYLFINNFFNLFYIQSIVIFATHHITHAEVQ